MDSVTQKVLQVGGASLLGLGALSLYRWSNSSNSKKRTEREPIETSVLFFNDASSQCYLNLDHCIDKCPLKLQCARGHIRTLVNIVKNAKHSVDICLYSLNHPDLQSAISQILHEGKRVRCVAGARGNDFIRRLRSEGAFLNEKPTSPPPIEVILPETSDLLVHHKFAIVDGKILITGSMNWTKNSFNRHWDHIIISVDKGLVKQFLDEFEYLYESNPADERANNARFLKDVPIQACFFRRAGFRCRPDANRKKKCARDDCMYTLYRGVCHKISSAQVSVDICAQQLTLEDLANELVFIHDDGAKVRIVCEQFFAHGTGSQIQHLMNQGIEVHMQKGDGSLHHKFIIVDGKTLLTGSLNWTMQSFFGNYENVLIIKSANIISKFQKEFDRLWDFFPPAQHV